MRRVIPEEGQSMTKLHEESEISKMEEHRDMYAWKGSLSRASCCYVLVLGFVRAVSR